jgi:hypothetical protein
MIMKKLIICANPNNELPCLKPRYPITTRIRDRQTDIVHLEQKLIPPGEYVPTGPEMDPPLTSHEEAIKLTDEFLKEKVGNEFFGSYIKVKGVDEWPYSPSTWIVLYDYTYNGYNIEFMIAIDIWYVLKDRPHIQLIDRASHRKIFPAIVPIPHFPVSHN